MPKLLCERPRIGHDRPNWNARQETKNYSSRGTLEELPTKQGMKRTGESGRKENWRTAPKQLNEYLNPLYRFLESCVGRKWDDVYSEVREKLNLNSAVMLHIVQHLFDFVEREVFESEGKIYHRTAFRRSKDYSELRNGQLYVCSRTDILKRYKRNKVVRRSGTPPFVKLSDSKFLIKMNGVWWRYEVSWTEWEWFADLASVPLKYKIKRELTRRVVRWYNKWGYHPVFKNKKQLNKKDLKKYKR